MTDKEFWDTAYEYAFTTGEEKFVREVAFIMTELAQEKARIAFEKKSEERGIED